MESKQTAVQWLEREFNKLEATVGVYGIMYSLIDQAKEMEKEQIVIAGDFCQKEDYHSVIIADSVNGPTRGIISIGEHYYNKTYGTKTES
jgi:hypothetical protein